MLFTAPKIDDVEREVIERTTELRTSLRYATQDPVRWQGLLRRVAMARAIRASNSIEGYNVTEDDALAAWEGQEPLDAAADAWEAVTCYRSAMTYVLELADDPHFGYSADLLRGLHFMMLQYDLRRNPGRWRPGPIYVRDERIGEIVYEAPDAITVPSLINELVAFLNDNNDANIDLVHAALAHLNLVMIHPFSDGNGRMARCLQSLTLARSGILAPAFSSIEEYLGQNTDEYYSVLVEVGAGQWSPSRDTRPWIRFCLKAHFQQATTMLRRTREMGRLWDAVEIEVHRRQLPDRTILALVDAALGFKVRNATYRSSADVSMEVASRDLRRLATEGLLEAQGERKGRHYVASDQIQAMRQRTQETKVVEDPFESPSPRQRARDRS